MGLYHHIQTAITFPNLIPFIYIRVYKFETIIQNPCEEAFDENNFAQNLRASKIIHYSLYIPCSNNFLHLINCTFIS